MPSHTGYQALSQSIAESEEPETDVGDGLPAPVQSTARRGRRGSRPGPIDLSKLDTAFKRWTEGIAQKVKRKKKVEDHSRREIWRTVFEPQVAAVAAPVSGLPPKTLDHKPPMTKADFAVLSQAVRRAILDGIHPKMITKGSSGSYFARAKIDGRVQTVAVFKPKDEEPYGRMNPKTTKWIHRQFRWIIPFGRACLIPNLSYISEAAASLLDERLDLHIVPRTELVSLSSQAFFYDWIDRSAAKKGKPLPDKIGNASEFLRKHPWPGRAISDTFDDSSHRRGNVGKRLLSTMKIICGKTGEEEDMYDDDDREDERVLFDATEDSNSQRPFYWSQVLQQSFREELEKLVILDYLMLNTDRGADNYMIKYCEADHDKQLVDVAPSRSARLEMPLMSELRRSEPMLGPGQSPGMSTPSTSQMSSGPSRPGTPQTNSNYTRHPHIHIAAIDNSLSFPHEHPKGWRSYTYGWLYLPVSVIGLPFSQKTRDHFLPLLTSKAWWEETTFQLRKLFAIDPDFHPKMFRRQLAVIKGQAWNIVQSLRHADEGPLELTRRTKVLVWDDEVEIDADEDGAEGEEPLNGPMSASPGPSINTVPLPPRPHNRRASSEFPPPMIRTSTDATGAYRPVPFSAKFQRVHPGTTGVTVLEHLERLDAVEASLQRLGVERDFTDEEEVDVGESSSGTRPIRVPRRSTDGNLTVPASPGGLPVVHEVPSSASVSIAPSVEEDEEDVANLSKSMSHVEVSPRSRWSLQRHGHTSSHGGRSLDWMQVDDSSSQKRTVVVERLETINTTPMCSCW
ncbi:hypothetical protein PLICRDRAFT_172497 [Plicaturopsis crispa FD-325 SS-3]|nr:hypothetical protein PLICRDRAFT_172497 [Plicaturopsis crispa FD-325 SS-3]